jgi:YD repeat-containing protein
VQAVNAHGASAGVSVPFVPDPSAAGAPPAPGSTTPGTMPGTTTPPSTYTIQKFGGDGQTVASGLLFPAALMARVLDASGQAVSERIQYRVVEDPAHARIVLDLSDPGVGHMMRDVPPVLRALPGATGPDASRPAVIEVSMFSNPSVTARFQVTVTRPEIRVSGTGTFGAGFLDPGQPATAIRADTTGVFTFDIGPGLPDPRRPVKLAVEGVGLLLSEEVVWAGQGAGRATVGFTTLPPPQGQMSHTATLRVRSTTDPTIAPVRIDIPVELRMNADRLVPAFAGVPGDELALHLRPVSGLIGGGVPQGVAGNTLSDPFNVELVDQHGARYTRAVRDHYESCTQAPVTEPFRVSWFATDGGTFSERLEPGQFGNVHLDLGSQVYFTAPDQVGQHQGPWFVRAQVDEWAPEDHNPPVYEQRDSQGNLIRCVRHSALQLRGSPTFWSWSFPVRALRQADALTWEVRRLGEYGGRVWQHGQRPTLGDRHADASLAAEILVFPDAYFAGGFRGLDVIGKRFRATFTIPEGVVFDAGLTARAYFDTYRHDLADYQEFTGGTSVVVDPAAPHRVTVDITADRPIHAVHLTKLRYRNLDALRGHAVPIEMAYTHFDVREAYGVVTGPGVPLAAPREVRLTGKLINLILMPRDLGRCEGSNGFDSLSVAGDHHNVPNGNLYIEIPVITTHGAGVNTDVRICHNSLLAIYEESLRTLLGGMITPLGRFLADPTDYGTGWVPGGWTHSYHVNLREHVQPLDDQGSGVVHVIDLAAPDGNRILFERKVAEGTDPTLGLGNYEPVFPGTLWLGDPALGCTLRLRKEAAADGTIGFLLRDLDGNRWRFDASGRLVEIANRLTDVSTVVDPLKITYPSTTTLMEITDSSGRLTSVRGEGIYTPDGFWSEFFGNQLLIGRRPVVFDAGQVWFLWREATVRLEGNRTIPLLSKLRDPTGRDNEYTYYSDTDFEGVPAETARRFWGRLGKLERGVAPDRRSRLWRYRAVAGDTQKVVYRNAARTETVLTYRRENLAVEQSELVVQDRDPVTLELLHQPNYDQVLAGGGSLPLRSLLRLDYKEKTKLVRSTTDAANNVTVGEYVAVQGGPGFLLQQTKRPDGTVWETEYDADNRVFKVYNPDQGQRGTLFTEYTYGTGGLLIVRTHPILTIDGRTVTASESWDHAPQTQLLDTYTDVTGTAWELGYGAQGRDPGGTRLPTSRSVDVDGQTLTWELTYDALGRAVESYEPLYGGTTRTAYHPLGPVLRVDHQTIPDAAGQEAAAIHFDVVDPLRRLICVVDPQGGVARWDYNQHGDLAQHHKGPGRITSATYRADGVLLSATDEAGATIRYVSDELGRPVRIDYPVPDDRPAGECSQAFCEVIVYDDANGTTTSRRYETGGPGQPLGTLVSEEVMTYRYGRLAEQASSLKPGSHTVKLAIAYDAWGNQREIAHYDGGTVPRRTVTFGIDAWGRVTETVTTADGETRTEKVTYDNAGRVVAQVHPDTGGVGTGISVIPKAGYRHDALGRLTHVENALGEVVRRIEYHDRGNRSSTTTGEPAHHRELGQNPALPVANLGPLVFMRRTDFNRRGLPTTISFTDAPGTDDKIIYAYAGNGLVVREEYAGGRKIHFTYDGAGRVSTIEKEVRRRAPGVAWATFDAAQPSHVESHRQVVQRIEYDPRGEVRTTTDDRGLRERRSVDRIGRLMRTERHQDGAWLTTEDLTYDALGRVIRRRGQGNALQTFTFSDSGRTLLWKLTNSQTRQEWQLTYDWEHKLTSFEQREYTSMFIGVVPAKITLTQSFNGFGQLRSKEWSDGSQRLAKIDYDYAGDLAWRRKVEVLRTLPDGTLANFVRTTSLHYDADGRLTHMQGGGQDYRFDYNSAGVLKALRRPLLVNSSTGSNLVLGNATRFSHDQKGRLTTIREERGSDEPGVTSPVVELSRASLHYEARMQIPWELDVPAAWSPAAKDLGGAGPGSLRGVTIGRSFTTPWPPGQYARDYVRDGEGQVNAAVSRALQEGARANVDSRHEELDARNQLRAIRHYRSRSIPSGTMDEFSYEVTSETQEPDGRLVRRASTRRPATPHGRVGQFQETNQYDPIGMPLDRYHVEEDQSPAAAAGNRAVPAPLQDYRQFVHDAAGRLAVMRITRHRRADGATADFNPSHAGGPGDSQAVDVIHYYAPDGELMWRSVQYWPVGRDQSQTADTLIVSDGSATIAEYDYTAKRLRYFENVPGTGVRLSAESYFPFVGADAWLYYRNGHEGATHFMTDERGEPVADFGLAAHDGEADLFGRRQSPHLFGSPMSALSLEARQRELWSYYQPQSPRVDLVAGQPFLWQREMQERMQSTGAPSALGAANNQYGFSPEQEFAYYAAADDPVTTGQGYSTAESIIQLYVDFWRGAGDVISFGLTAKAREWLWGKRLGGVVNKYSYGAGVVAGIAHSIATGMIAFKAVGAAARIAQAYVVGGDVYGVIQSTRAVRSGTATWWDFLGFLPMVGYGLGAARAVRGGAQAVSSTTSHVGNAGHAAPAVSALHEAAPVSRLMGGSTDLYRDALLAQIQAERAANLGVDASGALRSFPGPLTSGVYEQTRRARVGLEVAARGNKKLLNKNLGGELSQVDGVSQSRPLVSGVKYSIEGFAPAPASLGLTGRPIMMLPFRWLGFWRHGDTEFRVLEPIFRRTTRASSGFVEIMTDRFPCQSCWGAILAFQRDRPDIEVIITYLRPPILRKDGTSYAQPWLRDPT